jgi:hypothetical protein
MAKEQDWSGVEIRPNLWSAMEFVSVVALVLVPFFGGIFVGYGLRSLVSSQKRGASIRNSLQLAEARLLLGELMVFSSFWIERIRRMFSRRNQCR